MSNRTLPYVAFADFITALDLIAENPPAHIDRSCWSRLPSLNKYGRALCEIFQFLRLTSTDGTVLPAIGALLDIHTRPHALAGILRAAYPFVNPDDLPKATMDRMKAVFRQHAGGSAIARKALSFYLKAAESAGFALHPLLAPRARKQPRQGISEVTPGLARIPAVEESVLETLELEGGGLLTLKVEGQELRCLSGLELKLATAAAVVLKSGRKKTVSIPVARRQPESAKSLLQSEKHEASG